jgi:hypothetical protein
MHHDDVRLVHEYAAVTLQREGQVDFLGGVSVAVVESADAQVLTAAHRDAAADEVRAGSPGGHDRRAPERVLAAECDTRRSVYAERERDGLLTGREGVTDPIGRVVVGERRIVVEEDDDVTHCLFHQAVASRAHAAVLVEADPDDALDGLQGWRGRVVAHDDLVEAGR